MTLSWIASNKTRAAMQDADEHNALCERETNALDQNTKSITVQPKSAHQENTVQKRYVQVALPVPMHQVFDYELPKKWQQQTLIGCRVQVPFGRQKLIGVIMSTQTSKFDPDKIRVVYEILDINPVFDPHLLQLAKWCSEYYFHPLGEVLNTMVPSKVRQGSELERYTQQSWSLTALGQVTDLDKLKKKSQPQAQVISLLREHQHLSQTLLLSFGLKRQTLDALEKINFIQSAQTQRQLSQPILAATPPVLTQEQSQTLTDIEKTTGTHIVFGVTGSGKTEVYMGLIANRLAQQQQVLILVPEIGLTPQTLARFQKRFKATIAVLHSQQTDIQRAEQWSLAQSGQADLVIGTRSAVFAPMQRLGLIIIDEEHDQSYKQQDGMRYSARDIALLRSRWLGISIVLGSATPSLETLYNVQHKGYHLHSLRHRATGVALPTLQLVDLRRETTTQGVAQSILDQIKVTLTKKQQVLVFLNRRGFAPAVICNDCGWTAVCHHCDAKLTLHRQTHSLKCHHCDYQTHIPSECPMCNSEHLNPHGKGTERVEETLQNQFKEAVIRVDRDTMPNQKAFQKCLNRINSGEPLILLGTQMLSKGHDFAGVQLVIILDIDAGLFSSDFRAEEKISQLLTQVTGRAGRARIAGQVMVQTFQPHHQVFRHWHTHDYTQTAQYLLEQREAAGLPPYSYHILIRAEANQAAIAQNFLLTVKQILCQTINASETPSQEVQLLGPVNANMERRAGMHRYHLLMQSNSRRALHQLLRQCHHCLFQIPESRKVRWNLDIDPQDF